MTLVEESCKDRTDSLPQRTQPSPLSQIPPEIIAYIFQISLPPILDHQARRAFQDLRAVCSGWRQACFSHPQLWAALFVDIKNRRVTPNTETAYRGNYGARLGDWFERAGNLLLTLHFFASSISLNGSAETARLVRVFDQYRGRWKALRLHMPVNIQSRIHGSFSSADVGGLAAIWNNLQSLEVLLSLDAPELTTSSLSTSLPNLKIMPNLRKLTIKVNAVPRAWAMPAHDFGHTGLEELAISAMFRTSSLTLFIRNFSNIQKLSIRLLKDTVAPELYPASAHLPSLTLLSISGYPAGLPVLDKLECSKICSLVLSLSEDHAGFERVERLISFLEVHQSTLRSLDYSRTASVFSFELGLVLTTCSRLQHVAMNRWPYTDDAPPLFIPSLRVLEIGSREGQGSRDEEYIARANSVLSFIRERWEQLAAGSSNTFPEIERVVIHVHSYMHLFPHDRVLELREKGINNEVLVDM